MLDRWSSPSIITGRIEQLIATEIVSLVMLGTISRLNNKTELGMNEVIIYARSRNLKIEEIAQPR